jgi:hypothetical protein
MGAATSCNALDPGKIKTGENNGLSLKSTGLSGILKVVTAAWKQINGQEINGRAGQQDHHL